MKQQKTSVQRAVAIAAAVVTTVLLGLLNRAYGGLLSVKDQFFFWVVPVVLLLLPFDWLFTERDTQLPWGSLRLRLCQLVWAVAPALFCYALFEQPYQLAFWLWAVLLWIFLPWPGEPGWRNAPLLPLAVNGMVLAVTAVFLLAVQPMTVQGARSLLAQQGYEADSAVLFPIGDSSMFGTAYLYDLWETAPDPFGRYGFYAKKDGQSWVVVVSALHGQIESEQLSS